MGNPSNTMKKREKLQGKGQQQEESNKQGTRRMDTELSKGQSQSGSAVLTGRELGCELYVGS